MSSGNAFKLNIRKNSGSTKTMRSTLRFANIKFFLTLFGTILMCTTFYIQCQCSFSDFQRILTTKPVIKSRSSIPAYFINLENSTTRREFIERHLTEVGIEARRVNAFTGHDAKNKVEMNIVSVQTLLHPNPNEIACIASHLIALYRAVNDHKFKSESPYALILEDDVHLEFDIDFSQLIKHAPKDFAVLQLMTSNAEKSEQMFASYRKSLPTVAYVNGGSSKTNQLRRHSYARDRLKEVNLWEEHAFGEALWSTQAYIVSKDAIRHAVNRAVRIDHNGNPQVTLHQVPGVKLCRFPPCLFAHRIVADIYLYGLLGKTYVSKIPLLNGGHAVGYTSTIQTGEGAGVDSANAKAFRNISVVIDEVKRGAAVYLPDYIQVRGGGGRRGRMSAMFCDFLLSDWHSPVVDHILLN